METRRYLEELGVKNVDCLKIDNECTAGWHLVDFIKVSMISFLSFTSTIFQDFRVKDVDIGRGLPDDVLRSLLQLNVFIFYFALMSFFS